MLEYIITTIVIALLVTTWLRNYQLRGTAAGVDEANVHFTSTLSKRGSSRRKAFYKRNSPLNDYLEKNLSKGGDNVQFQSSFPWKSYVQKSRHESKIQDLDQAELKLYESIFEIILTEKSYLLQLEHLTSFADTNEDLQKISKYDRNLLLGNIHHIYATNAEMYGDFESAFQSDIFMSKIFAILSKYLADGSFQPYIDYIKGHQERNRLINDEEKVQMVPDLAKLRSLIIIPMQRITRYPLLVQNVRSVIDKILSKSPDSSVGNVLDRSAINKCFEEASKFAAKCNKALDDERKLFDLITFKKQLIGGVAIGDLVARDREIFQRVQVKLYFVKQGAGHGGQVVPMPGYQGGSLFRSFNTNSMSKVKSTLVLLTDMLIITEYKKKQDQFIVIDHDKLTQVQFDRRRDSIVSIDSGSDESMEKITEKAIEDGGNVKAQCTLTLKSHENSYGVTFLSVDDEEKFLKKLNQLKAEACNSNNRSSSPTNGY